mgnify:CR=1 FL=1
MRGRELGRLRGLLALSMELRRWLRCRAANERTQYYASF